MLGVTASRETKETNTAMTVLSSDVPKTIQAALSVKFTVTSIGSTVNRPTIRSTARFWNRVRNARFLASAMVICLRSARRW